MPPEPMVLGCRTITRSFVLGMIPEHAFDVKIWNGVFGENCGYMWIESKGPYWLWQKRKPLVLGNFLENRGFIINILNYEFNIFNANLDKFKIMAIICG